MHDLNDLYLFAQVIEKGGFSKAAKFLGVPKSRVSRRVAELETRLGVLLLQRTTRRIALTDVGRNYYEQCQAMVSAAKAAEESVNLSGEPRGHLRVSAPLSVAQHDLGPHLGKFVRAYPHIRLELRVTNRRINLIEEEIDVALRVRAAGDEDPHLITRKVRPSRALVVGSPQLLEEHPPIEAPGDLSRLPALHFGGPSPALHWVLQRASGETATITYDPCFFADDFVVLKNAALESAGITLLPEITCRNELAQGRLVEVLPGWYQDTGILQAVYPTRRGLSPAVRAFIDFVMTEVGGAARAKGRAPTTAR
ncbi:LysR family transcriptional regulator [Pendulispora albinea]|uniref:LysR family transcriptional regulator n=1 Tax=Pendulispora albinea TaxID=2741071 RepID=A0ABZ2LMW5_9BACT